jgi:L-aspartate oxidase
MIPDSTEILVIGSGIAGLCFSLKVARKYKVMIVTKQDPAEGSTNYAQGGIASVLGRGDSFESHIKDTLKAGAGLCDAEVVRTIVSEGPAAIRELVAMGVQFSHQDGGLALGQEGGHSARRIVHAQDRTGYTIEKALLDHAHQNPNITFHQGIFALDLYFDRSTGRVAGAYLLDPASGEVTGTSARVVLLSTGGCGRVYVYTTNPDVATGDGIAMAWNAGARIANCEFMQFHPTTLYVPGAIKEGDRIFLISEAVRGEGGVLINKAGEAFMAQYDERKDLAPRDIVARAIDEQMKTRGDKCVYLDVRQLGRERLQSRFPTIYNRCLELGIDIAAQPIPVVPAAHYMCGGVKTDMDGHSSVPGLYAAGEVACTGMHGANRLASNSLLEAMVVSHRAAGAVFRELAQVNYEPPPIPPWHRKEKPTPHDMAYISHDWRGVRRLMWDLVGIVRTDSRLGIAHERMSIFLRDVTKSLERFNESPELMELRNIAIVGSLIIRCAMRRKESRGLHYNTDHPVRDDVNYGRDTVITKTI